MEIYRSRDIGRTVQLSHCRGARIDDSKEIVEFSAVVYGSISTDAAQAYFRRKLKDDSIIINSVETDTDYYSMDLQTFLENATKRKA